MQQSKWDQRRALREKRANLTLKQQALAAERLARQVVNTHAFKASHRIACYFANDGEIEPSHIIERIWAMGKSCYLPVLSSWRNRLLFAPLHPDSEFSFNRFGIPEPIVPADTHVRAQELDLILMPLVGFDAMGNRLGMGGGFYDRSLAFLRHRRHWDKPRLIGLAHECQRVERLTAEPWDIPLKGIVTDQSIYPARGPEGRL